MLAIPQTLLEDKRRRRSLTLRIGSRKALGFGLLGVAVVIALLWSRRLVGQSEIPEGVWEQRAALIEALGPVRPFEGRLVGFGYAPVKPLPEGWRTEEVAAAIRAIDDQAELRSSPRALANVGVVELLHGRFDQAVGKLQRAAWAAPKDAQIQSDLAAALLARGKAKGRPYDLLLALVAADQAVGLSPDLPEPRFNLALILSTLEARTAGKKAWFHFLQSDQESGWSGEAHRRAADLVRPSDRDIWAAGRGELDSAALQGRLPFVQKVVGQSPQLARLYVEDELLGKWAEAKLKGQEDEAERRLHIARVISSSLADAGGDPMPREVIRGIDSALDQTNREEWTALANGYLKYREALALLKKGEIEKALGGLQEARESLKRAGSPFSAWVDFHIAFCDYQNNDYEGALRSLEILIEDLEPTEFHAVKARSLAMTGLIHVIQGRLAASLQDSRKALGIFELLKEDGYAAGVHSLIATDLSYLGEHAAAWEHLREGLAASQSTGFTSSIYLTFEAAALVISKLGHADVALHFQDEAVRSAVLDPAMLSEALRGRASIHRRRSDSRRALSDLAKAEQVSAKIPDEKIRRVVQGDVLLVRGEIEQSIDRRQAVRSLDEAVTIFKNTEYHYQLARGLMERGLAYAALGDKERAQEDLRDAVEQCEEQRGKIEGKQQASFLDSQRAVFQEMIRFQIERAGDADSAFGYAERRRARVLLDWILSSPVPEEESGRLLRSISHQPLGAEELRNSLPQGVVLISYLFTGERLVAWVFRNGESRLHGFDTRLPDLTRASLALRSAIQDGDYREFRAWSSILYRQIIRPISAELRRGDRVIVVLDGPLHSIPISALFNERAEKYLIEDHPVAVAPSASVVAKSLRRGRLALQPKANLLLIGNPSFDTTLFPKLQRLPGAGLEAGRIKQFYPDSKVLMEEDATRSAFLASVGHYAIVHVGSHAVSNSEFPLLSFLLLAPEAADSQRGVLYARDLLGHRFHSTRLVVLAACRSGIGRYSPTEGPLSLAQPFLAGGVPAVVASLWDVRDDAAGKFFENFYADLSSGADPMKALQIAQVGAIHSEQGRNPSTWAGWVLIGAVAD